MREKDLIKKLIDSGDISGAWNREFPVHPEKLDKTLRYRDYDKYVQQLNARGRALRIDALCINDKEIYIIEAKKMLVPSALGQLLCYRDLFEENYPDFCKGKTIVLIALVHEDNKILRSIFDEYEIQVWVK